MSKIVRHEFVGSWVLFSLLCLSLIGIPAAILYLINGTVRVEEDLDDVEEFLHRFRSRRT